MSRKVLFQLVLPLIGLSILFWLLAFAPGERKNQPALLEMSVILRDGDGAVSTMRRGMEQAAVDLNVELRFLTPSADNSAIEQTQLLERETAGGTQAILLLPADRGVLGEAVSAAAGRTALVTVETDMTEWGAGAAVTMDHQALGEALGEEAAAQEVAVLLGPGLNVQRSPLCGRDFEYFSEDPILAGRMAAAYVRGIQKNGISVCPKHFAVNSQELRRMASDSVLDERTLRELYLTGFEIVVKEAKPKTCLLYTSDAADEL